MIHLDTSFLITGLIPGSTQDTALRRWLEHGECLAMCTVAWTEFLCGPVTVQQINLAKVVVSVRQDLKEAHAIVAAELFNATGRRRGSLIDCMIAAAALDADAAIATMNLEDFERFKPSGLALAT